MLTSKLPVEYLLEEAEREVVKYDWEGTFADYLRMAIETPGISRLSHQLLYDAIMSEGVEESVGTGQLAYSLFEGSIFGLEDVLERIVQHFAAASRSLEIRKRALVLLGPRASGKSTIVSLIKQALERFTRMDEGIVYAIKGCPMQEDPFHLIPLNMRAKVKEEHGIYIEGDLCPRCRYVLHSQYQGRISEMPVLRVAFSEQEAVGMGYYTANGPSSDDASLLTGNIDTTLLSGARIEVTGKAVRMDGQMNTANRGLLELDQVFKIDNRHNETLLDLVQEQAIKMERFGWIYADEVVVAHSSEEDYKTFMEDERSELLRGRVFAVRVPYNLRARDEVKIYRKMLKTSGLEDVHIPPLTLTVASTFALLTRLETPREKGVTIVDKLKAYDGEKAAQFSRKDLEEEKLRHSSEGMYGISPRYVINRLIEAGTTSETGCITPLKALDSLWRGLNTTDGLEKSQVDSQCVCVCASLCVYDCVCV